MHKNPNNINSRRVFLKKSALLGVSLLATAPLLNAAFFAKRKIGIQLFTLKDVIYKDPKGTIEKIGRAGYREIETFDFRNKTGFWNMPPAAFGQLLKDNGLSAVSGHYTPDMMLKDGNLDDLKRQVEAAAILKSKYLTIPWMEVHFRRNADDYKRHAATFNKAGEICKASGLTLAYHNHDFEFDAHGNTNGMEILLNETDKSLMKFEMDIYWVIRSGKDPIALFNKYPGRFPLWHVKDMDKNNKDLNTEVGNGAIDFKSIFANAKASGMKHFFVEQETNYKPDFLGSIEKSFDYIKTSLI